MSNKKISCGGFSVDNETIIEENGVLKAVGGGGSSLEIIHATVGEPVEGQESQYHLIIEETAEQILAMEVPILVVDATTLNLGKTVTSESVSALDADGSGEIDFAHNADVYMIIGFSSGEISAAIIALTS